MALGLFLPPFLTWYVDSLVDLIMQQSLLGHGASCYSDNSTWYDEYWVEKKVFTRFELWEQKPILT